MGKSIEPRLRSGGGGKLQRSRGLSRRRQWVCVCVCGFFGNGSRAGKAFRFGGHWSRLGSWVRGFGEDWRWCAGGWGFGFGIKSDGVGGKVGWGYEWLRMGDWL